MPTLFAMICVFVLAVAVPALFVVACVLMSRMVVLVPFVMIHDRSF